MRWPPAKRPWSISLYGIRWERAFAYLPHHCFVCKWGFWWEPCLRGWVHHYAGDDKEFMCGVCRSNYDA